jgi:ATPase subunit of ABC transporter with duplicated ATPase domains
MARIRNPIAYDFSELSDGQRQLIVLYSLLYVVRGEGYSLFLDEPDNYLALREVQPWLASVEDACGESISQAVLISHHPEIIDYLSGAACRWFDRPDNGPTRVMDQSPKPADGLKTSETIARGLNS